MFNQETDRQVISNVLKHLDDLGQKMTVDGIIRLLPVWFLQRLQKQQRQRRSLGEPSWRKPRTMEEMAEEFALSERCGALIYEIQSSRPRMAYTKSFVSPASPTTTDKFAEDESNALEELEYWQHGFMDTFDKITKW